MKPFRADRSEPLLEMLIRRFPELKRTKIIQVLKHGSVLINGRVVTLHRRPISTGDEVSFLARGEASAKRLEHKLGLAIAYEDDSILVVDKPAGLLTIATEQEREHTLYAQLTKRMRLQSGGSGRVFIVHRLDRDTSGLVVFAKTEKAKNTLQANWDQAVKQYAAIVEGVPRRSEDVIQGYLREDRSRRVWATKHAVKDSKPASTRYRTIKDSGRYALLEIFLETGRKNQIRAHLSSIGCPVAGDRKYGAESDPIGRLALHATELSFPHPDTGERKTFRSRLPADFTLSSSI